MPHPGESTEADRQVAIIAHATYLSAVRARLFLPALLVAPPLSLAAQAGDAAPADRRASRRTVMAIVGAIAGGAGGAFFSRQAAEGACQGCYIAAGALIGGIAGFFIGRELDQMHDVRFRGVPRMRIPFDEQALDGDPLALTARDTLLAVATTTGVTILSSTGDLRALARRANGIRGISALDLTSRTHAMAVATPTGLYLYPPIRGPGVLLREGTIQAASASDDHVFFAIGPTSRMGARFRRFRAPVARSRSRRARRGPGVGQHATDTLGADGHESRRARVGWRQRANHVEQPASTPVDGR